MAKAKKTAPPSKGLTADEVIDLLKRLPAKAVAFTLGVASTRTLNENVTLCQFRQQDGSFDVRDLIKYATEVRRRRQDRPGDARRAAGEPASGGVVGDGGALEAKRRLEAERIQLEILRLQKELVPVGQTVEFFAELSARLRTFGEVLQRDYGPGAALLLNELLGGMESHVARWVESIEGEDL